MNYTPPGMHPYLPKGSSENAHDAADYIDSNILLPALCFPIQYITRIRNCSLKAVNSIQAIMETRSANSLRSLLSIIGTAVVPVLVSLECILS